MNEPADDIDPPIGTLPVLDSGLAAVFRSPSPWGAALQDMQDAIAIVAMTGRPGLGTQEGPRSVH